MEPARLGPYSIGARLGRGGMGAVYEAVDAITGTWLRHLTIPVEVVAGIVGEALGRGLSATVYDGDERRELAPAACGAALDLHPVAGVTRIVLSGDPAGVAAALPGLAGS